MVMKFINSAQCLSVGTNYITILHIRGPILHYIPKITTFRLEMSNLRPLKLLQKWSKLSADAS